MIKTMKKKNFEIKPKFINHLMGHGRKKTSEKILLKSFKELQKNSFKKSTKILKLALIYSTNIFKLRILRNKKKKKNKIVKKIPAFITKNSRTSLAIKFILTNTKKKENFKFYQKLIQEIVLNAQNKSSTIEMKNEIQQEILDVYKENRHFLYYKW
jgi:ribosomal protein S7